MNIGNLKWRFSAFFFQHDQHSKQHKLKTCSKAACLILGSGQVSKSTEEDTKDMINILALTPSNECG